MEIEIVDRITNIGLEEALEEISLLSDSLTSNHQFDKWGFVYAHMLNDRGFYRLLGVENHYCGEKDGSINPLADARLRLLSFYVSRLKL